VQGQRRRGVLPAEVSVHEAYESASVACRWSARDTCIRPWAPVLQGFRGRRAAPEGVRRGREMAKGAPNTPPSQATGPRVAEVSGRGCRRCRGSADGLPQWKVFGSGRGTAAGAPRPQ
jgi:hypothetical protein